MSRSQTLLACSGGKKCRCVVFHKKPESPKECDQCGHEESLHYGRSVRQVIEMYSDGSESEGEEAADSDVAEDHDMDDDAEAPTQPTPASTATKNAAVVSRLRDSLVEGGAYQTRGVAGSSSAASSVAGRDSRRSSTVVTAEGSLRPVTSRSVAEAETLGGYHPEKKEKYVKICRLVVHPYGISGMGSAKFPKVKGDGLESLTQDGFATSGDEVLQFMASWDTFRMNQWFCKLLPDLFNYFAIRNPAVLSSPEQIVKLPNGGSHIKLPYVLLLKVRTTYTAMDAEAHHTGKDYFDAACRSKAPVSERIIHLISRHPIARNAVIHSLLAAPGEASSSLSGSYSRPTKPLPAHSSSVPRKSSRRVSGKVQLPTAAINDDVFVDKGKQRADQVPNLKRPRARKPKAAIPSDSNGETEHSEDGGKPASSKRQRISALEADTSIISETMESISISDDEVVPSTTTTKSAHHSQTPPMVQAYQRLKGSGSGSQSFRLTECWGAEDSILLDETF